MTNLIRSGQKAQFMKAIQNVTDTFFQRYVTVRHYPLGYDDFGRLIKDETTGEPLRQDTTDVPCLIETSEEAKSRLEFAERGPLDGYDYMLTCNAADLVALNLLKSDKEWQFNNDDVVLFEDRAHQLVWRAFTGQFQDTNVLVELKVKRLPEGVDV